MASVARKYSNISFDEVRSHLVSILQAKEGSLADFGDSTYGKTIIELFAGTADLMAYYAESSFENAWIESATTAPAIYSAARMLGYSVRRPVPAKAGIGIVTTKTGIYDTIRVYIPKGTVFRMSTRTMTAMSDMEFTYNRKDDVDGNGLLTLTSGTAVIAEGTYKTEALVSNGQQNQVFYLPDTTFSDYFGENDPNYADDGNVAHRSACFTTISSDATLADNIDPDVVIDDKLYWRVSRRGLIDPSKDDNMSDIEAFAEGDGNYTTNYSVIVATSNDGGVMLRFGDGIKSAVPYGDIHVKYFSTQGEAGNLLNVSGTALSTSNPNITITQADGQESDITLNDLNICLVTDLRGGLDIESNDSIKNNASQIYATLDRLVTRASYKVFLRRYADIKYASAYGEDILNTKLLNGGINVKYMNQIRFSVLKDLYRERDGKYYPTTADEYYVSGYKVNGLAYTWEYDFQDIDNSAVANDGSAIVEKIRTSLLEMYDESQANTIISKAVIPYIPLTPLNEKVFSAQVTPMDFVAEGSELHSIMVALNQRGMITLGGGFHNYVYPSVHHMEMKMDIVLFKGNNFTDIRERIKSVVYKYLKENTEFGTPIYRSKIASLVHTMTEVAGVDVYFQEEQNGYQDLDLTMLPWMGDATGEYVTSGSVEFTGSKYSLKYDYQRNGHSDTRVGITDEFELRDQSMIQSKISEYYRVYVAPEKITDKLIDQFCAFIWECVMHEIYVPIYNKWIEASSSGTGGNNELHAVMECIKTWDRSKDAIAFKNTDHIFNMVEVNGNVLFDYISYGLNYIKLVRNVLKTYSSRDLIDPETGNITNYTNDNEIVQFNIPNELINLSVAYDSSLLTE